MSDFEKDSDCIAHALQGWANWIETGDMTLSSGDAVQMMRSFEKAHGNCGDNIFCKAERRRVMGLLKPLTDDQKAFVVRLRELAKKARGE